MPPPSEQPSIAPAATVPPSTGRTPGRGAGQADQHAPGHLPGLDGVRALAIGLVLLSHAWTRNDHSTGALKDVSKNLGGHGVTVFLVVSGFLITTLLLRERESTGRIDLLRFAARRAVRLWPALWLVVGATVVLAALGQVRLRAIDVASSLLFFQNYVTGTPTGPLRHTWSLSLEEQFYVAWPLLLLLLGRRWARWVLLAAVAAAPALRMALWVGVPGQHAVMNYAFHTRYDSLAVGCLLALWWDSPRLQHVLARSDALGGSALAAVVLVVALVAGSVEGHVVTYPVGYSLESLSIAYLLARAVVRSDSPDGGAYRALRWRPLAAVGVLSYDLYLWQQLFLIEAPGPFAGHPALGVVVALALAWLTHELLERPLAPLRRRLRPGGRGGPHAEASAPRELAGSAV